MFSSHNLMPVFVLADVRKEVAPADVTDTRSTATSPNDTLLKAELMTRFFKPRYCRCLQCYPGLWNTHKWRHSRETCQHGIADSRGYISVAEETGVHQASQSSIAWYLCVHLTLIITRTLSFPPTCNLFYIPPPPPPFLEMLSVYMYTVTIAIRRNHEGHHH